MSFVPSTDLTIPTRSVGDGDPPSDINKLKAAVAELRAAGLLTGTDLSTTVRAGTAGGPARLHYAASLAAAQALVSGGIAAPGDWIGTP